MAKLFNAQTNELIGSITDEQLGFLVEQLEEEGAEDQDYYLDASTVDLLEQNQADPALIALLREVLGDAEGIDVRWSR